MLSSGLEKTPGRGVCRIGSDAGLGRERGDRGDYESPLTKFISVMKTILTSVESTLNWGNKESGNSVLIVL